MARVPGADLAGPPHQVRTASRPGWPVPGGWRPASLATWCPAAGCMDGNTPNVFRRFRLGRFGSAHSVLGLFSFQIGTAARPGALVPRFGPVPAWIRFDRLHPSGFQHQEPAGLRFCHDAQIAGEQRPLKGSCSAAERVLCARFITPWLYIISPLPPICRKCRRAQRARSFPAEHARPAYTRT